MVVDLMVLAGVVFAFGLVSGRLEGTILRAPIMFVVAGIAFGPAGLGLVSFELDGHTALLLGEIALALVLFTDAAGINLSILRQNEGLPLRLLGVRFSEAEGQLLNLSVFFVFGVLVAGLVESLHWTIVLYALLSLTVIRMLPVALSLYGTHLHSISVLFAGWFGPRGLASIVLGLIVVEEAPLLPGREEIELVVALTVLLSVVLHGITAAPLSAVYACRVQGMAADAPEKQGTGEPVTRGSPAKLADESQ